MAEPTKQEVIDRFDLLSKTSAEMKPLISGIRGMGTQALFMNILSEKELAEKKADRLVKFNTRLKKIYTSDDLVEIDGVIGFDLSLHLEDIR